jgi:hypothetical protein
MMVVQPDLNAQPGAGLVGWLRYRPIPSTYRLPIYVLRA